jgi:cell division protein FtsI (penicillin-binding protein 3)
MDIELPGITKPKICNSGKQKMECRNFSFIAYGYSSNINLLQLATFYNGVANGGKMLKPLFIDKIMKDGK